MLDLDVLEYRTLADDPESLAHALYGSTWRRVVRALDGGFRTTRNPTADYLADFLGTILVGLAHDGRSDSKGRTLGWWKLADDGRWTPADVASIPRPLHRAIRELSDRATEATLAAAEARRGDTRPDSPGRMTGAEVARLRAHREALLREELLSALSHVVSSRGRTLAEALNILRTDLPLPDEARAQIARDWLAEALASGDLEPSRGGRISVTDVCDLRTAPDADDTALPVRALCRALDDALGPRIRRVEWQLPPDLLPQT